MDPFSSLSIAAAVVQFLEFGTKLVSGTCKIYRSQDGSSKEISELSRRTERLGALASSVTCSPPTTKAQHPIIIPRIAADSSTPETLPQGQRPGHEDPREENKFSPESARRRLTKLSNSLASIAAHGASTPSERSEKEESLNAIATDCKITADELSQSIAQLTVEKRRHDLKAFDSFRQALQNEWGKRKLQKMEAVLNKYQSDMTLHLVAIISDQQSSVRRDLQAMKDAKVSLESAHGSKLERIEASLRRIQEITTLAPFLQQHDAEATEPAREATNPTIHGVGASLGRLLESLVADAGTIARTDHSEQSSFQHNEGQTREYRQRLCRHLQMGLSRSEQEVTKMPSGSLF